MRKIPGFDYYYATEDGKIYSTFTGELKELKQRVNTSGYYEIDLGSRKGIKVHRLIAVTFIENPEGKPQVNHKDGNKLNNHVSNLEWVTNAENQKHAWDTGLQKKRLPSNATMTFEKADQIRKEYDKTDISHSQLAKKYDVSKTTIGDILRGNIYTFGTDAKPVIKEKTHKLNLQIAEEIRKLWETGEYSYNKLGNIFGVNHKTIKKVVENKIHVQ